MKQPGESGHWLCTIGWRYRISNLISHFTVNLTTTLTYIVINVPYTIKQSSSLTSFIPSLPANLEMTLLLVLVHLCIVRSTYSYRSFRNIPHQQQTLVSFTFSSAIPHSIISLHRLQWMTRPHRTRHTAYYILQSLPASHFTRESSCNNNNSR